MNNIITIVVGTILLSAIIMLLGYCLGMYDTWLDSYKEKILRKRVLDYCRQIKYGV